MRTLKKNLLGSPLQEGGEGRPSWPGLAGESGHTNPSRASDAVSDEHRPDRSDVAPAMKRFGKGYTLVEVILCACLFMLLLLAVYRLFFAQVRSIRSSLEHIGVNENVRLFMTRFGNDIRNASYLTEPTPSVREGVPLLLPAAEGVFCSVTQQVFDFAAKPPDPNFIREVKIDYRLQKGKNGTFEIIRDIKSNATDLTGGPAKASRKVCDGVKEIYVFTEIKRPAKLSALAVPGLTSFLSFEPYETDGTAPSLVHVRATFVRPERARQTETDEKAIELRTCFAMRGRQSYPNP